MIRSTKPVKAFTVELPNACPCISKPRYGKLKSQMELHLKSLKQARSKASTVHDVIFSYCPKPVKYKPNNFLTLVPSIERSGCNWGARLRLSSYWFMTWCLVNVCFFYPLQTSNFVRYDGMKYKLSCADIQRPEMHCPFHWVTHCVCGHIISHVIIAVIVT